MHTRLTNALMLFSVTLDNTRLSRRTDFGVERFRQAQVLAEVPVPTNLQVQQRPQKD